jgi:hypothetical protein
MLPVASEEWHQWGVQIAQIIAKAWVDDAFKARFMAAPVEVLAEHGLIVPSDVTVKVNENSTTWSLSGPGIVRADTYEIPLPPKPSGDDLLQAWAEGDAGHAPVVSEGGRVAFGKRVAATGRVSTGPRVASKPRVSSAGRVAGAGRVAADDDES